MPRARRMKAADKVAVARASRRLVALAQELEEVRSFDELKLVNADFWGIWKAVETVLEEAENAEYAELGL